MSPTGGVSVTSAQGRPAHRARRPRVLFERGHPGRVYPSPRRHRGGDAVGPRRAVTATLGHSMSKLAYHLGLDGRRCPRQADPSPPRPACVSLADRRVPGRPAGGGGGRARPQLQPRPRRHRGWRSGAAPSAHAVGDLGRATRHQCRRRALRALAAGALRAARRRRQRASRARDHARLRRDLPRPVRGPVPRHQLRAHHGDRGRGVHRDDRQEDRRAHRRIGPGGRTARDRRSRHHRGISHLRVRRGTRRSRSPTT